MHYQLPHPLRAAGSSRAEAPQWFLPERGSEHYLNTFPFLPLDRFLTKRPSP
ncbi:MAG: hypothetical protein CISAcid_07220 [uncultured Acidilobus sp. CIS]|jgi:hypothetical protein|nr:MAG: hypothetical protein CISAcid_07220 [uncultured Acidilobus sp. CIS]